MRLGKAAAPMVAAALLAGAPALAGPTPEEQALRAVLDGRIAEAVRILQAAASGEEGLRTVAGRVALAAGDLSTAGRLFTGSGTASAWGLIDTRLRSGDTRAAAEASLRQMDAALRGEHREAVGRLLVQWASERAEKDPDLARRMADAVLALEVSAELRAAAEDVLFRDLEPPLSEEAGRAARRRLTSQPDDPGARFQVARMVATGEPGRALALLVPVVGKAERALAVRAARAAAGLDLPPAMVQVVLDDLGARFPGDEAVAKLRLQRAQALARTDPDAAGPSLFALLDDATVGGEAAEAWAAAPRLPAEQRLRWLEVAGRYGTSARGDLARTRAREALIRGVEAAPEGEARWLAAQAALKEPDARADAVLSWYAVDTGPGRTDALWALAERYPGGGRWCGELADRLVTAGVDGSVAARYARACTSGGDEDATLLRHVAEDQPYLALSPIAGGVAVLASGASALQVQQHGLDPEQLFRSGPGDPLTEAVDAWLVEPDTSFTVPADPARAVRVELRPRGAPMLAALTVRAGDRRATSVVVSHPLEVQALRLATTVVVAVIDGGRPAAGTKLRVQDGNGRVLDATTGKDGAVRVPSVEGAVRILATRGNAVGYSSLDAADAAPQEAPRFALVLPDRRVTLDGARRPVRVFAASPLGAADTRVRVRSLAMDGEILDETNARTLGGGAAADLWLQGDGSVEVVLDGRVVASTPVPADRPDGVDSPAVTLEPAAPRPGDTLRWQVHPRRSFPPEGLDVEVELHTPWEDRALKTVLRGEAASGTLDLSAAQPGDIVAVVARVAGRPPVGVSVPVGGAEPPPMVPLPPWASAGKPFSPPRPTDVWLRARMGGSLSLWVAPNEPLVLPVEGLWTVTPWRDGRTGPPSVLRVLGERGVLDASGKVKGTRPALAAWGNLDLTGWSVLLPGASPPLSPIAGARLAWVGLAGSDPLELPVAGPPGLVVRAEGHGVRGGFAEVDLSAGLPPGTRVWAFARDGSDHGPLVAGPDLDTRRSGAAPSAGTSDTPVTTEGEPIATALLAEEERIAEQAPAQRVNLRELPAAAEAVGSGALGLRGMGSGGGGYGSGAGGMGRRGERSTAFAAVPVPDVLPGSLALLDGGAPGVWRVPVPPSISALRVEVVALAPDGRWGSDSRVIPVTGPAPTPPERPAATLPAVGWDGSVASLLPVAASLPVDARRHALAALASQGVVDAVRRLKAAMALPEGGPGRAIAAAMKLGKGPDPREPLARLEGLPDQRFAERALAALEGAPGQPERAAAAARRLLREPDLDGWVRARAGLALWAAGARDEALEALSDADPLVAAARAVVDGRADASAVPAWWAVAGNAAAAPHDRALALHALALSPGRPVGDPPFIAAKGKLATRVLPAIAEWRGTRFPRGWSTADASGSAWKGTDRVPVGRRFQVTAEVPAWPLPSRLRCPDSALATTQDPWVELAPSPAPRWVECTLDARAMGTDRLGVSWYEASGVQKASGTSSLTVGPAASSATGDPMSSAERHGYGIARAREGDPEGMALVEGLLRTDELRGAQVAQASAALLDGALVGKDPRALIVAFEAHRERSPTAGLDLSTAAAVGHAYLQAGEARRADAAARIVLDARFREELGAVQALMAGGMHLTALKLLTELLGRYPEVPAVIEARYLAPSMLLDRAEGDGDRMGYTRASLRHTAAGDLARFLLVHGDDPKGPEAAVLLADTLRRLRDPGREQTLAGPLARRYRESPQAWRLSVADARARFAQGRFEDSLSVLKGLPADSPGAPAIALERGRALEALGRRAQALVAYRDAGGLAEAMARARWLDRNDLDVAGLIRLRPGEPARLPGWLPPGSEGSVTAYRIALESLLLAHGGDVDPEAARVDGLRVAAAGTYRATAAGDLPLPSLPEGAYLLTATVGPETRRSIVLRSDLEISVRRGGSSGTLIHVQDAAGRPAVSALLWVFAGSGPAATEKTDPLGAAHLALGTVPTTVLARSGNRYALWQSGDSAPGEGDDETLRSLGYIDAAEPASDVRELIQQNAASYEGLFRQGKKQQVQADAL